jgi:hypothetical protein
VIGGGGGVAERRDWKKGKEITELSIVTEIYISEINKKSNIYVVFDKRVGFILFFLKESL